MKHKDQYKMIIPSTLWHEANVLIEYVSTFPYLEPTSCKYCGSNAFNVYHGIRQLKCGIPTYYCHDCKRRFSQITGSYFKATHELASWGDLARLRLAGKSTDYIARKVTVCQYTVNKRVKTLEIIMQDKCPKLYQWFKAHNDYLDHSLSVQVKEEVVVFTDWLGKVIDSKKIECPTCHRLINRLNTGNNRGIKASCRPLFACGRCRLVVNLLADSPLKTLFYIEKWPAFTTLMIKGESHAQISKQLGVSLATIHNWNAKFIQQMRNMGLEKLVYWLSWQHRRGYAFRAKNG